MLSQFSAIFWHLYDWWQAHPHCDLTLVEAAMSELLDAWTDALMSGIEEPTDKDLAEHCRAISLVCKF